MVSCKRNVFRLTDFSEKRKALKFFVKGRKLLYSHFDSVRRKVAFSTELES